MARNIEVFSNTGHGDGLLVLDARQVVMTTERDGKEDARSDWRGYATVSGEKRHEFRFYDGGLMRKRLDYVLAAERSVDDPVACPVAALVAAKEGCHSSGLGYGEIEAVVKSILPTDQFDYAKKCGEKYAFAKGSPIDAWSKKLAEIEAASNVSVMLRDDVGARRRSRAYPEASTGNGPNP
jgi:hypothetical protein